MILCGECAKIDNMNISQRGFPILQLIQQQVTHTLDVFTKMAQLEQVSMKRSFLILSALIYSKLSHKLS